MQQSKETLFMAKKDKNKKTEEAAEAEVPATGGKKKMILLIVGALVLVGGAVGGTLMVVGGGGGNAEEVVEAEPEEEKGDPSYISIKPAFTVNLEPDDPVNFLQISLQVLTFNDDVADDLEKHNPLVRNNLVALFGRQKSETLRTPEGKLQLQQDVLDTIQSVINEYGSGGEVSNVFFTSFVMQ